MQLAWGFGCKSKRTAAGQQDKKRSCLVGRQRHIVDIADAQQPLNIRLMRVGVEWIDQEDHRGNPAFGGAGGNLGIAAHGATQHPLDRQSSCLGDPLTGGACGDELEVAEQLPVRSNKAHHIILLAIMGDQCYGWKHQSYPS
jgi:hypothetical protein